MLFLVTRPIMLCNAVWQNVTVTMACGVSFVELVLLSVTSSTCELAVLLNVPCTRRQSLGYRPWRWRVRIAVTPHWGLGHQYDKIRFDNHPFMKHTYVHWFPCISVVVSTSVFLEAWDIRLMLTCVHWSVSFVVVTVDGQPDLQKHLKGREK